eukprot:366407-Chlamydomonas_euryale.AAC.1
MSCASRHALLYAGAAAAASVAAARPDGASQNGEQRETGSVSTALSTSCARGGGCAGECTKTACGCGQRRISWLTTRCG